MLINSMDLLIFLTAALSLNLTPGNDMMYVLGQSLKGGPRSGFWESRHCGWLTYPSRICGAWRRRHPGTEPNSF